MPFGRGVLLLLAAAHSSSLPAGALKEGWRSSHLLTYTEAIARGLSAGRLYAFRAKESSSKSAVVFTGDHRSRAVAPASFLARTALDRVFDDACTL
jgi:hypothetical protein